MLPLQYLTPSISYCIKLVIVRAVLKDETALSALKIVSKPFSQHSRTCLMDPSYGFSSLFNVISFFSAEVYFIKFFMSPFLENSLWYMITPLSKIDEKDEYIFAVINMHKFEYACKEVDEIIWDTEILCPIELRNFVKDKVEAVIKKYEPR